MNFASDNVYPVHPDIMQALADANHETAEAYAGDRWTRQAEARLADVFECDVSAFLLTSGSAANGLALAALTPPHGAVFCHRLSHINETECNLPEFFTGGAKMIGLNGPQGKITVAAIERHLQGFTKGDHDPRPAVVSLTNATEMGTVYSCDDVNAFAQAFRKRGMKLHMDGARFANALAHLHCSPAQLTWQAGVDALSFGATKNGAMMLEAVIFFDKALAQDFGQRRMRAGQLLSKSRYLGAQMLAYLENDLWLHNARQANALTQQLAAGLLQNQGLRLACPVQANEIFVILPTVLKHRLRAAGAVFYDWLQDDVEDSLQPDESFVRLVLSYATPQADIEKFLTLINP